MYQTAAEDHYLEALDVARHLVAMNPSSQSALHDLVVSLDKVGDVFLSADREIAQNHYLESLRITRQLAAANPASQEAMRDLVVSLNKIGSLLTPVDRAAAEANYLEAVETSRQLISYFPDDRVHLQLLGYTLQKLSSLIEDVKPKEAARLREEIRVILCQLKDYFKSNKGPVGSTREIRSNRDRTTRRNYYQHARKTTGNTSGSHTQ
ncbi:hypothetical protein [Corynebacterium meridianum]|uniref:Tetratricopeptide repeat protein n=1 Tax=Corynebacterium meridianum TaxID=2765363 RepID=A0A934I1A4_9CORY|nr:hypothetical protein [Corynebacterium meridianum]MBI8989440.1 hypothetical protein [Corynebacterium meridianum]